MNKRQMEDSLDRIADLCGNHLREEFLWALNLRHATFTKPGERVSRRTKGDVSRPTEAAAWNGRRKQIERAVRNAEKLLEQAYSGLVAAMDHPPASVEDRRARGSVKGMLTDAEWETVVAARDRRNRRGEGYGA